MNNTLIICTYMRPHAIIKLLDSVCLQTNIPFEIVIVDGSINNATESEINNKKYTLNIQYFLVDAQHRGLTKQRNFGISKSNTKADVVSFLDDDVVLKPTYFEEIEKTFLENKNAVGVGGIDLIENVYKKNESNKHYDKFNFYEIDGWHRKESSRNKIRKLFLLMPDSKPNIIPPYSHGRTSYPPNGKTYEVEHLIGLSMSFKKELMNHISFSNYFEGYGLYEDFDFCVRALAFGNLYINTNAQVWHYHEPSGRPNLFKYGKMVVRNGWYVWRVRFPKPTLKAQLQWNATCLLLAHLRLFNFFSTNEKANALNEYRGRMIGWFSLIFNKPQIDN